MESPFVRLFGVDELASVSFASTSIAGSAFRLGYPVKLADGSFSYRGKGIIDILTPVAERLDDALMYFVGRSASDQMGQALQRLITPVEIFDMLALETPEMRKAFAEYQAWNKGVLDFAEAQGVITPEIRKLWLHAEYMPIHHVSQHDALKGESGVKALTGGTDNIKDVLGNIVSNAAKLIEAAGSAEE
jgi:hypothetical protein